LRGGRIVAFIACSKLGDDKLKVVLKNGRTVVISRKQLSEAEIARRFGAPPPPRPGRAVYVKSKLPIDFDPTPRRAAMKKLIGKLRQGEYNAIEAAWKRLLEDDKITRLDQLFLPEGNDTMKYYYFIPEKKNLSGKGKVPLVVFLHGIGEYGRSAESLFRHPEVLVFISPENQKKHPCYFLAPQIPKGISISKVWTYSQSDAPADNLRFAIAIIDEMLKKHPGIDRDRIYVTGLSSGGFGSWAALAFYPGKFAGAVPISAGSKEDLEGFTVRQRVGVWAFNNTGEAKSLREGAKELLKKIAKLGGDCRYTEFEIGGEAARKLLKEKGIEKKIKRVRGHFAWKWAYFEPKLIPWLFSHRRDTGGGGAAAAKRPPLPSRGGR
jgi:predicted peptidase